MDDKTFNKNQGALFRADKNNEEDRDYAGSLTVEAPGEYWVSGYLKISKAGTKYLALRLKAKNVQTNKPAKSKGNAATAFDDPISF